MEGVIVLVALVVLAIPVLLVVALALIAGLRGRVSRLEQQLAQLQARAGVEAVAVPSQRPPEAVPVAEPPHSVPRESTASPPQAAASTPPPMPQPAAASPQGMFFYLYLFLDVWSRKIVAAQVFAEESMENSARLFQKACWTHAVSPDTLVLHSDNGVPMKGSTMLVTLQKLGVVPSFSRPRVSDDNPSRRRSSGP